MKIALVILHADAARGGAERYTIDLATWLATEGHDVSLLASTFKDLPVGVKSVPLDHGGITRVGRYRSFLKSLTEATAPGRFDIVHAMLPVPVCDLYHPHAGIAAEAAFGSLRHRLNRRRSMFAAVEKRLMQGPNPPVVLSLSDVIGTVVQKWYPNLPADRRVKLFNGVDTEKFRPAEDENEKQAARRKFGLPADVTLALIIAQDFVRKGLGPTIEALKLVDPKIHLVVAGRDDQGPFRALASSLQVNDRVHWIGPTDDPASLYQSADFFVLPTRHDPCSLVVLEAIVSGIPVITTEKNGASEVMLDAIHGFVLPDPGVRNVGDAMSKLGDRSICFAMGFECRKLRGTLSSDHHFVTLLAVYEAVLVARRLIGVAESARVMSK